MIYIMYQSILSTTNSVQDMSLSSFRSFSLLVLLVLLSSCRSLLGWKCSWHTKSS